MQDLTLIGVHEDGAHLLLADADGTRYTVPLDESLRAAVRSDRPRLGTSSGDAAEALRPAAVQALIRTGLSAEEVAHRAGWTVEKVHRYEGPILAEREHVASLARAVRLRARGAAHGAAATLDTRVGERLRSREIDAAAVSWDSRRADRGDWVVSLAFAAGGRRREATWAFDPLARTVAPLDDESRWLSEDDDTPAPGPLAAPHLSTPSRPSRVYDVEAEGGVGASSVRGRPARSTRSPRPATGAPPAPAASVRADATSGSAASSAPSSAPSSEASDAPPGDGGTPLDLVAAMRQRNAQRGRRRRPRGADVPGLENAPEDALPLEELAMDPRDHELPPAQHPRDDEDDDTPIAEATPEPEVQRDPDPTLLELQPGAAQAAAPDVDEEIDGDQEESPDVSDPPGISELEDEQPQTLDEDAVDPAAAAAPEQEPSDDGELTVEQVPRAEDPQPELSAPTAPTAPTPAPARPAARKGGRPSVPSWDDIMFGRKGD